MLLWLPACVRMIATDVRASRQQRESLPRKFSLATHRHIRYGPAHLDFISTLLQASHMHTGPISPEPKPRSPST